MIRAPGVCLDLSDLLWESASVCAGGGSRPPIPLWLGRYQPVKGVVKAIVIELTEVIFFSVNALRYRLLG